MIILLALAVFIYVQVQPTHPQESLCAQGATLNHARLLQKAQETIARGEAEGESCSDGELARTEDQLEEAERAFASARAFGAIEATGATEAKQKLVAQRNANHAIRRYVAGLSVSPFDEAARIGLARELATLTTPTVPAIAFSRCRLGSSLAAASLLEDATTAVSKGLAAARRPCRKVLVKINSRRLEAASLSRQAQRLSLGGGSPEAIRQRYADALRANAELGEARSGLESHLDDQSKFDAASSWLSGIPATLKTVLEWLVPLLGLLLVIALLVGCLARLATRSRRTAQRLATWATAHPSLSFLRYLAVPRVAIVDFEGGSDSSLEGKDFSTLLAESLPSKAGREPTFPFDRVTKGSESDQRAAELSEVFTEVPQGKALGSALKLLGRLFQRRRITVGGRLVPITGARGAGVTIALEGVGSGPESNITLWEGTYDPLPGGEKDASRWVRLVPAAKVWVRWQIATCVLPHLDPSKWLPDALFQAAVAWQAAGDAQRAEALYVEALELDSTLLPAMHNLAAIEVRDERYAEARERLLSLQGQLRTNPQLKGDWPLLETGYLYTLVLAYAYDSGGGAEAANTTKARDTARQLVGMVATRLDKGKAKAELEAKDFAELERTEAPSVVVLASLTARADREAQLEAVKRIADGTATAKIGRQDLYRRLEELKPWELVDGYVLAQPNLTRRTLYNLACYYTALAKDAGAQRGVCLDRAVAALQKGLEGRGTASLVHEDPTLAPLRADERWAIVEAFLKGHSVQPHAAADPGVASDGKPSADDLAGPLGRVEAGLGWILQQIDL